jgi:hypothetical protein
VRRPFQTTGSTCIVILFLIALEACDSSVQELSGFSNATALAKQAAGPVIITADNGEAVVAYLVLDEWDISGGPTDLGLDYADPIEDLTEISLTLDQGRFFFEDSLQLQETISCALPEIPDRSCFNLNPRRQVYNGRGKISWQEIGANGLDVDRSSVAEIRLTSRYVVNANPAEFDLGCDVEGEPDEVICVTIEGTMLNPFPGRRPDFVITAKSMAAIRPPGEDPAPFIAYDVVLETFRTGTLEYRPPTIVPLPVRYHWFPPLSANNAEQHFRIRAAIDPGTTTLTEIALFYSAVPEDELNYLGSAQRDPETGLVELCLKGAGHLDSPPGNPYSGELTLEWRASYAIEGGVEDVVFTSVGVQVSTALYQEVDPGYVCVQ